MTSSVFKIYTDHWLYPTLMVRRKLEAANQLRRWLKRFDLRDLIAEQKVANIRNDDSWLCTVCDSGNTTARIAYCCGITAHERCMLNHGCPVCGEIWKHYSWNVGNPNKTGFQAFSNYIKELLGEDKLHQRFVGYRRIYESYLYDIEYMTFGRIVDESNEIDRNVFSILALCPLTWPIKDMNRYKNRTEPQPYSYRGNLVYV